MLGPINTFLGEESKKGVTVEDNLSLHKTADVLAVFKEELCHFAAPRFVPPNMTWIVQVIDRHIGIMYKLKVYAGYRKVQLKRLKDAWKDNDKGKTAVAAPMSPKEKRILITKIIGHVHEEITLNTTYFRAFIATGTYMHVGHLMNHREDDAINVQQVQDVVRNAPEDAQVSLQHMENYNYAEKFMMEKVLEGLEKLREEELKGLAEAETLKERKSQ